MDKAIDEPKGTTQKKDKGAQTHTPKNKQRNSSKSGKLDSMFLRFAQGESFHRFQAERVGDHCLPTTISDLQKRHSIFFSRKFIKVPNRFGTLTPVKKYWLEGANLMRAKNHFGLNGGEDE